MKARHKNPSDLVIREFRMEDYDRVIALWGDAQLPYRPKGRDSRDRIEQQLKQRNIIFLVAEIDSKLVGSVIGTHVGRKGWINRLAVDPQFQRQGIAKRLVAETEDRLAELGIEVIACLIEAWNNESMEVFQRLGYEKYSGIAYFSKRKGSEA